MSKASASTSRVPKRLHIGGLNDQISPKDLAERFSRYGQVDNVEAAGIDGVGQMRRFAYLTLIATPQEFKKCVGTMQSGMWRGAKLKIAEAKPKWDERQNVVEAPKSKAEIKVAKRKSKRRKEKARERRLADTKGGRQTGDMSLVTTENYDGPYKKHWHLTPSRHLIRPIYTRPTHPLMRPIPKAVDVTEGFGKKSKKSRSSAPNRAKRVFLDPSRYGIKHLAEADLESQANQLPTAEYVGAAQGLAGFWDFQYDDEEGADETVTSGRWVYISSANDEPNFVEEVSGKRRRVLAVLQNIASTSIYPDTLTMPASPPRAVGYSKAKTAAHEARNPNLPRLEDELEIMLEDETDLWDVGVNESTTREASPLFDTLWSQPTTKAATNVSAPRLRAIAASPEAESDNLPSPSGDDDLFSELPTIEESDDDLFSDIRQSGLPGTRKRSHQEDSEEETEVEASEPAALSAEDEFDYSDPSYLSFVEKEKARGLELLSKVDLDAIPQGPDSPYSSDDAAEDEDETKQDDEEEEEKGEGGQGPLRLRGGGSGGERPDAEADSSSDGSSSSDDEDDQNDKSQQAKKAEDGDDDDSSSDDDSDSDDSEESSDSSDSSDDEDDVIEKKTLKDVFAPKADEGAGFSLLAGMDLELDSEDEEEIAPAKSHRPLADEVVTYGSTPSGFAPYPAAVVPQLDSALPLFFAPFGMGVRPQEAQKVIFKGNEIQTFVQAETE